MTNGAGQNRYLLEYDTAGDPITGLKISVTMWAVFFDRLASAAGTARAAGRYILIEQLLASAGDGVGIEAEELSQNAVATMSQFDGLQAGEQAALLFVEQAIEKQNHRFQFIGRYLESGGIGYTAAHN
jgi:hypothetical protein